LGIEAPDGQAADGGKPGVAVLVEIGASGASNGFLGRLLQGRGQGLFRPPFFRFGRMPPFKDLRDRILGNSTLLSILLDLIWHEWTPDSVNVPLIIEDGQACCQSECQSGPLSLKVTPLRRGVGSDLGKIGYRYPRGKCA